MSVFYFENHYCPVAESGAGFSGATNFPHDHGVAFEDGKAVFASGLNNGSDIHHASLPVGSVTTLKEWVAKTFGDTEPTESEYVPGTSYKRMSRPVACRGSLYRTISQEKVQGSFVPLRILLDRL
jgi:hypothetical protein